MVFLLGARAQEMGKEMKFSCKESCGGKCCTLNWKGQQSFVFLTRSDRRRLAQFLDRPEEFFASKSVFESTRFSSVKTQQYHLKMNGNDCKFFRDGQCGVYAARPTQCRTFPYWPENLKNGEWTEAVKAECPGVGQGASAWALGLLAAQREADHELEGNTI